MTVIKKADYHIVYNHNNQNSKLNYILYIKLAVVYQVCVLPICAKKKNLIWEWD